MVSHCKILASFNTRHNTPHIKSHGRQYPGKKSWTKAYRRWLSTNRFEHSAQQIVFQDYIHAVTDAEARVAQLEAQIAELLPDWSLAPVVQAIQAMRGVAFIVAVTVVAEVGDFRRFATPRQLMAYLGLTPTEHSSGNTVRRGGITKVGSSLARRVLIEGAWSYRMQPRVGRKQVDRLAEHLKRSDKLFMDETTPPVLNPGRGKTKTGYLDDLLPWNFKPSS